MHVILAIVEVSAAKMATVVGAVAAGLASGDEKILTAWMWQFGADSLME